MKYTNFCGYVRKLKSESSSKMISSTNLRWVEVNHVKNIFGYKNYKSDNSFSKYHAFNDIVDFKTNATPHDRKSCNWAYAFQVITKSRRYVFFVQTENEHRQWCQAFEEILVKVGKMPKKEEAQSLNNSLIDVDKVGEQEVKKEAPKEKSPVIEIVIPNLLEEENIVLIRNEEEEEEVENPETSYCDVSTIVNFQKKQRKFIKSTQSSVNQISAPIFYFRKS